MPKQPVALPPRDAIGPETPLRLDAAAALAFPGAMTASGLRRERDRGHLEVERIAGKKFTTLAAIERMRERCRSNPRAPDFGSGQPPTQASPSGSSATTEDIGKALASALMRVERLRKGLPPTSERTPSRLVRKRALAAESKSRP